MSDMKYYAVGVKHKETPEEKLKRQLEAAANGLILAMRAARAATRPEEREEWLFKARRFKAYLERLGKNK